MAKLAEVALGERRVVVDTKDLIWSKMELLAEEYASVKKQHSLFAQFPINDDETVEEWSERVSPLLLEENKKKDGEDSETYMKRVYSLKLDKQKLVKDTVAMIATVFGQGEKICSGSFDRSSYPECKSFIIAVFEAVDLSTRDFE